MNLETIRIATLATAASVWIAFPIAFWAACNTSPNTLTWFVGRFILVTSRSVNTVVWGLLFVAVFGPGPMAGFWAIAFRSIGFMDKLKDFNTISAPRSGGDHPTGLLITLRATFPPTLGIHFGHHLHYHS